MFEERLLDGLKELQSREFTAATPRRRHVVLKPIVIAAACVAAAASVPAVVDLTSQPAYAVSANPDGSVTFIVYKLSHDLDGATARLRAAGVPAVLTRAQPPGSCTPSPPRPEVPGLITYGRLGPPAPHKETATVTVHPDKVPPGEVVDFAYYQAIKTRDSDVVAVVVGLYDAPGPNCVLQPRPGTRR